MQKGDSRLAVSGGDRMGTPSYLLQETLEQHRAAVCKYNCKFHRLYQSSLSLPLAVACGSFRHKRQLPNAHPKQREKLHSLPTPYQQSLLRTPHHFIRISRAFTPTGTLHVRLHGMCVRSVKRVPTCRPSEDDNCTPPPDQHMARGHLSGGAGQRVRAHLGLAA